MTILMENGAALAVGLISASEHSTIVVGHVADRSGCLMAIERPLLQGRSSRRCDEFSSGRFFARRAMAARGLPESAVLSDGDRAPVWPAGMCGSLTHSRNWVAAGVSSSLDGLGIDLEHFGRLSRRAAERILLPDEQTALTGLCTGPSSGTSSGPSSGTVSRKEADFLSWATLVFSAKEAVYKAIYPQAKLYIGYREVSIGLDPDRSIFTAHYTGPNITNAPLEAGRGHWWVIDDVVLTRFEIGGGY